MFQLDSFAQTMGALFTGTSQVLLAFGVVLSLLQCFFGYKLVKIWAAVTGFLVGWFIVFLVAFHFLENPGIAALIGVVGGVLLAMVAFFLYRMGIFVFCFFQGASLCLGLIPDWPGVVVGIIVGLAVAILAMKFMREVMIVSSALSGGFNAGNGLLTLFSVTAGWPVWVLGILLTAAGIFVQWTTTGDRKDGTSL